jgi:sugar phosphate isomerase/epimerase
MSKLALNGGSPVRSQPFFSWPIIDEAGEKALLEVYHSGKWWRFAFGQGVELAEPEQGDRSQVVMFQEEFARHHGYRHGIAAANVLLTGYPEHWIRILGKRIKRVHIKDFRRSVGTAEGFVDLLQGDVDFAAVKAALSRIGYRGYVTAEILSYAPGRPAKTAAAMRKIFG